MNLDQLKEHIRKEGIPIDLDLKWTKETLFKEYKIFNGDEDEELPDDYDENIDDDINDKEDDNN